MSDREKLRRSAERLRLVELKRSEFVLKATECTCPGGPEDVDGNLVHWSTCPANEGGCTNGACEL